ncbi:MAG: hypothetical protein EKK29_12400 [Hyphomicrobiales bacterium]|jgi:hypothetical protein|nr:MAG: hypothetical protein EKK29_12400 [Hyphomicrobiales bacterium]
MSTERPHALLEFGPVAAAAGGGGVPEVRVSVADAPGGGARLDEAKPDEGVKPEASFLSRAVRAGRAFAAYAIAGVIGWHLYDLARPVHIAWPDLSVFGSAQKNVEEAEFRRVTQKLAADIQALEARLDALEKARGHEARNNQSIEEVNRRIDEMKAGVSAEVGALAGQIKEAQREAEAKRAETHVVPEPAESRVAGPEGHAHRPASVAAHVEAHWKRGHRRGDAFDPALHPNAPGAPRPLGSPLYRAR